MCSTYGVDECCWDVRLFIKYTFKMLIILLFRVKVCENTMKSAEVMEMNKSRRRHFQTRNISQALL